MKPHYADQWHYIDEKIRGDCRNIELKRAVLPGVSFGIGSAVENYSQQKRKVKQSEHDEKITPLILKLVRVVNDAG